MVKIHIFILGQNVNPMSYQNERALLKYCLGSIAKKHRLPEDNLAERDFQYLSEEIFKSSGIQISTITLRRLWNQQFQKTPQIKTLDALAMALEYKSWHEFKLRQHQPSKFTRLIKPSIAILLAVIFSAFVYIRLDQPAIENISIKPRQESYHGIPATVSFDYNLDQYKANSLELNLSKEPIYTVKMDNTKDFIAATYFHPDFYQVELTDNGKTLETTSVHITHDGWHTAIMRDGCDINPIQVASDDLWNGNYLTIDDSLAIAHHLGMENVYFSAFSISNKKLDSINLNLLDLELSLGFLETKSNTSCHVAEIVIRGEQGDLKVPIYSKGCHSASGVIAGEVEMLACSNDLSALTMINESQINIRTDHNYLKVAIDGQSKLTVPFSKDLGNLKTLRIIFLGPGKVALECLRNA